MADDKQDKANNQDPKQTQPAAPVQDEASSLEKPATAVAPSAPSTAKKSLKVRLRTISKGTNLYLLGFISVVIFAAAVIYIALKQDTSRTTITINDDQLTQQIIDDLTANESRIGDVTQTLTVEANTIFNGKILVKDSLDVAGSINVGGPLTLPGITVSGSSTFDNVEVGNNLSILGNTSVQGALSVQNGLSVTGNGTFTGNVSAESITANTLEIDGDLIVSRHIDTSGAAPSISSGVGVGSGGTVSVSGTDTAGTVTINTGGSPSSGIMASLTFQRNFTSTPSVIISPANSNGASIEYYVIRSTSGFSVRFRNVPVGSATFIFDYFVLE